MGPPAHRPPRLLSGLASRRGRCLAAHARPRARPPFPPSQSVRRADQEAINEFGRLNIRRAELAGELAELEK
jgi:hypothetical protein